MRTLPAAQFNGRGLIRLKKLKNRSAPQDAPAGGLSIGELPTESAAQSWAAGKCPGNRILWRNAPQGRFSRRLYVIFRDKARPPGAIGSATLSMCELKKN
ncbi:MAG: hypothetical protein AB2705_12505 [Candidatus Thiodiazotropha sp.]